MKRSLCVAIILLAILSSAFSTGVKEGEKQAAPTAKAVDWNSTHPPKMWTIQDKIAYTKSDADHVTFKGENLEYLTYTPGEFLNLKGTIIYSSSGLGHPWRAAESSVAIAFMKEMAPKVKFTMLDAKWDANLQISQMRGAIASKPDILGFEPQTVLELSPVCREAVKSGIPVITWDRTADCVVTTHVGATDEWSSRDAAKQIAKLTGGKANIIELYGTPGASVSINRSDYFKDELKKYPGLKIIESKVLDFFREPAMKYIEDCLVRYKPGQIQAIYSHNDEMNLGAVAAIEAAGRQGDGILILGHDGQNEAIQAIADGKYTASYVYHPVTPEGCIAMLKMLEGKKLPAKITLPSVRIDKDNVDKWLGVGFGD